MGLLVDKMLEYTKKMLGIYQWNFWHWVNRRLLKTYPLIEDCARCRDCGRNVHDFIVPDDLWIEVIGHNWGVWCYDCFCNRADEKLGLKWRMEIIKWRNNNMKEENTMDKLEITCVNCGKTYKVNLPDDPILHQFKVLCKECSKDPKMSEKFISGE